MIEAIYCLTKREKEIYLLYTTKNSLGRQFLRQNSGQFRDLLTTRKQFAVLRRHLEMNDNPTMTYLTPKSVHHLLLLVDSLIQLIHSLSQLTTHGPLLLELRREVADMFTNSCNLEGQTESTPHTSSS